jgi:hypothetical protein
VGQERTHALLVDLEEAFASRRGKIDGVARSDEILFGDDAVIDAVQHGRFGHERAELFHEIESQRGAAETWLVIESNVWVETDSETRESAVFAEHTVAEGKKRVEQLKVGSGAVEDVGESVAASASLIMPLKCWKYWLAAAPSMPRSCSIEVATSASSAARLSLRMTDSGGST